MEKLQELKTESDIMRDEEYERAIKIIDAISDNLNTSPNLIRMREWNKQHRETNAN